MEQMSCTDPEGGTGSLIYLLIYSVSNKKKIRFNLGHTSQVTECIYQSSMNTKQLEWNPVR